MKRHLLFILLLPLLFFEAVIAQDLKELTITGKAKKLDSELVARRDQNGNYCAAIQVISDMDGFSYDSNDGIVGKIENKPGKDIVYLTSTERVLEVFKSGYEPLKIILSEYGITLQQRQMWQIKIAGEEGAETLPVTIRFEPADAIISIDGKVVSGNTHNLSKGDHTLKIEKPGFQTKEETISINEKNVFFEWEMEKSPDAGLQITTTPEGTSVYLDGVKLGVSPIAVFYPPGSYPIKITKEGYVPIENEILEVILPQTQKSYTLEENVGYLTINTHPEATVYFNDEIITDPTNIKLAPQIVMVKVTMSKADDIEEQVVIKKDDNIVIDLYPNIQTGTIQVAVTPFDAMIELAGDAGERYTARGMKIFEEIPVGTYTLKVKAVNYKTGEETIILESYEKVNKSITLEKGSDADFGIEMVFVKGGTFTMGCTIEQVYCYDAAKPAHQVTVSDYYIGKYEVTQKQWRDIMGTNPSYFKNCDKCPIENVSWKDIHEFIDKLIQKTGKNYRLPTEAEWEYAARGGNLSPSGGGSGGGFKYSGSNNIKEVAWFNGNSGSKTHPVGQKKANGLGLYDMTGNVAESCSDWYGGAYYSSIPQLNPKGPASGFYRVSRSGSWIQGPTDCQVSVRNFSHPGSYGSSTDGFRLAISH